MACSDSGEGMKSGSVLTLPGSALNQLVLNLERKAPRGNDWRGLAGCVGFNANHISRIDDSRSAGESATCMMLKAWDRSGRSSVDKLIVALRYEGREDCLRILKREPCLKGVDFKRLYAIASRLRESEDEKISFFPYFQDGDLTIGNDVWSQSHSHPAHGQETLHHEECERESEPQLCEELQRESSPAHTPNEECPPSSANSCAATDGAPSKNKVFLSYYPDPSTNTLVEKIARELVLYGFTVEYASERQMTDPEFKMKAIADAYNILVLCTQRYFTEYQALSSQSNRPSKILIDRSMINDIYFREQLRIICLVLDRDGPHYDQCIPSVYSSRPVYRYPSQVNDLLHCVSDVPKFLAPKPVARRTVQPIVIDFEEDVRLFDALHGIPGATHRSKTKGTNVRELPSRTYSYAPRSIAPQQLPSSGRPRTFWRKLFYLQ